MLLQSLFVLIYIIWAYLLTKGHLLLRCITVFLVILYGLQLLLAVEDPYNYYTVSFSSVLMFNLQIIFILLGIGVALNSNNNRLRFESSKIFNIKINRVFIICQTILLLLTVFRYNKTSAYIVSMDNMNSLARDYYFTDLYDSYSEMLLYSIVDSFVYISYFVSFALLLFCAKKKHVKEWYVIISTLLIIVLKTLTSLGRGVVVQMFVIFLLFLFYSWSEERITFKKKVRPASLLLITVVSIVLVVTTLARFDLEEGEFIYDNWDVFLLKPFATYLYVPICAFDYGKDHIFNDIIPMVGTADFAGLFDFFLTPFRIIDHDIISFNNILGERMTPQFSFPSGERWNALFTGASNYYIDFGFLGFFVFPFFHGYLLTRVLNKSKQSGAWFVVLLYLFLASFNHMKSSEIQSMSTVFVFIWIYYMSKRGVITNK